MISFPGHAIISSVNNILTSLSFPEYEYDLSIMILPGFLKQPIIISATTIILAHEWMIL